MWNSKKVVGVGEEYTQRKQKNCIGFSSHIRMKIFDGFKIKRKGPERE